MHHHTADNRKFRILTILDEFTRQSLAIEVNRKLNHEDVLDMLTDLFIRRGTPAYIRSDNGAEFTARVVREWLTAVGVKTLYISPGSPWENGYIESFNGKLRDEVLNVEIFDTLLEARVLIERWRREYNHVRPHSSLGYRPPAPEAILPNKPTKQIVSLITEKSFPCNSSGKPICINQTSHCFHSHHDFGNCLSTGLNHSISFTIVSKSSGLITGKCKTIPSEFLSILIFSPVLRRTA